MSEVNYNHLHKMKSHGGISGAADGYTLTVGDIRDAIARLPDHAEVIFGTCPHGEPLEFGRFKVRGENLIAIEFN